MSALADATRTDIFAGGAVRIAPLRSEPSLGIPKTPQIHAEVTLRCGVSVEEEGDLHYLLALSLGERLHIMTILH